jgi:hypothetical protein
MTFFELVLISELVACFGDTLAALVRASALATGAFTICLNVYLLAITLWCVAKLKRIPGNVSTVAKADA